MKFFSDSFGERTRSDLLRFSLLSALIAFVGSFAIVALAYGIAHLLDSAPATDTAPDMPVTAIQFFGVVVFAPAVETAALAVMIGGLSSLVRSTHLVAVLTALAWGGLHALASPFWFFGTVWSFFVYGHSYLYWRHRSLGYALAAAAIPHALVNSFAFALVALSPSA